MTTAKEDISLNIQGDSNQPIEDDFTTQPNSPQQKFLNTFAVIIPKLFIAAFIGVVVLFVLGFVTDPNVVWGIFAINVFISAFGAWAVYQYGVIQEQIEKLKKQNEIFKNSIEQLKQTREKLKGYVDELNESVKNLQTDANKLSEQTKEFEPLIEELKKVAGNDTKIQDIINETNQIFNDMRRTVLENERAHLLSTYYDCAFRDSDNTMSKKEYKKFRMRLTTQQRKRFDKQGTFEELAGEDNEIDLKEFQNILNRVLSEVDILLQEKLKNQA